MKYPAFLRHARKEWRLVTVVALVVLVSLVLILVARSSYCASLLRGAFLTVGEKAQVSPGYVLIAPYVGDTMYKNPGEVFLLDVRGRIVHTWRTKHPVLSAILQDDGSLFVAMTPPINQAAYPSGGTTGLIEKLDWEGNVLWSYADNGMSHDFDVLPNESIAYIRWALAPESFAERVRGGMQIATSSVWANDLVVINKDKEKVWEWKIAENLNPDFHELGPFMPRSDWSHANSIVYLAKNPITQTPAYLVSMRTISTVYLIDEASGRILWQSPRNMFALQHDATLLSNGNFLVFDNGLFRTQDRPYLASRVAEIDPFTKKVVWQYRGGKTPTEQVLLASSIMGAAQRLENGNTLVTASTQNRVFEVTPEGDMVWDYLNRFVDEEGRARIVFKARKYTGEGTRWASWLTPHTLRATLVCGR